MAVTISGSGVISGTTSVAGAGGFNSITRISESDPSWVIPPLADPVVRVTVVGGGGGGGHSDGGVSNTVASPGGTSSFSYSSGSISASGGFGAKNAGNSSVQTAQSPQNGFRSFNGGVGGTAKSSSYEVETGTSGGGGAIFTDYVNLSGETSVEVIIGAGGAVTSPVYGGSGSPGGNGFVIVEYRAA